MLIYLVSVFWAVYLIILFAKDRLRAVVNPVVQFAVAQIVYFTALPDKEVMKVGLVHVITSGALLAGFALARGSLPNLTPRTRVALVDSSRAMCAFLMVAVGLCLLPPVLSLSQGISLFDILTSFYTLRGNAAVHPAIAVILKAMTKIPFIALILGRIWFHISGSANVRLLWYILFFLQSLVTLAAGARSGLVFLFACVVLGDAYVLGVMGVQLSMFRKLQMRTFYLGVGAFACFGIMFLTAYRSVSFKSVGELKQAAVALLEGNRGEAAIGEAAVQNINSAVAFTVDYYAENPATMQGIYAQVVNVVPRYLWPGKPVGFGKVLAYDWLGVSYEDGHNVAAGIGGEAFFNLGWPGVFIFPFLFGIAGGWMYRYILFKPNIGVISCILIFIAWGTGIARGDWLSSINVLVYQIIVFFPTMFVIRTLMGQPTTIQYVTKWGSPPAPNRAAPTHPYRSAGQHVTARHA